MKLVIAEKPSVAQTIAKVLGAKDKKDGFVEGNGYVVSWCHGHLVALANADAYDESYAKWSLDTLPIVPTDWKFIVTKDGKQQFNVLKGLFIRSDITGIINACDAGREGELIFRLVYNQIGSHKPVERLWLSSMEEPAISEGFAKLASGADYDRLYASALCRAQADWLVGINATRLFSVLHSNTLNIGRVQTPTLKMLVDRHHAIQDFKSQKYYHVHIKVKGIDASSERFDDRKAANALFEDCVVATAAVTSVEKKKKTSTPPELFDLTSLQREANRLFGYTAQKTLNIAQKLYEQRLLTYPRTDSRYLTNDMGDTAAQTAHILIGNSAWMNGISLSPSVNRLLDSTKVSDHHALMPTNAGAKADLGTLAADEGNILGLVRARLLMAVAAQHRFETTKVELECADHTFTASGKVVLENGWKDIEERYHKFLKVKKEKKQDEEETILPKFEKGEIFPNPNPTISEHDTTPPKPYTEAGLLAAMERAGSKETTEDAERRGLGTPATRAGIIEKLVKVGFVERKGKQMLATEKGIALISILPDNLTSPLLTAEWENALTLIAKKQSDPNAFMVGIEDMVRDLVQTNASENAARGAVAPLERRFGSVRVNIPIGTCPRCGAPVSESQRVYGCTNRNCGFAMWKNDKFFTEKKVTFTKKMATDLLKKGKTNAKGLYSAKTGKTYDATIVLEDTGKYVNYKLDFTERR